MGSPSPPSTEAEPHPTSPLCTQGQSTPTSCAGELTPTTPFNQEGPLLGARGPVPSRVPSLLTWTHARAAGAIALTAELPRHDQSAATWSYLYAH